GDGEGVRAFVGGGEGVVGRQRGGRVGTAQVDRTGVARGDVAERVEGFDCEGKRLPAADGGGEGGEAEGAGRGRRDRLGRRGGGGPRAVGDGERLRAGRRQHDAEGVRAVVGGGEGVVSGQAGLGVAAVEMDRAGVVGVRVARGIEGRDGDRLG